MLRKIGFEIRSSMSEGIKDYIGGVLMRVVDPWIYISNSGNVWKFYRNDNGDLLHSVMYGDGKWTKASLIDTGIVGFAVYIDDDETIHIVYSNIKGELKYCTMKNKQWFGKLLYSNDSDYEICELKAEILGVDMHIFFLLAAKDGSDHGMLMHCKWNGNKTDFNMLQDIIMVPDSKEHYGVQIIGKDNIQLFFITDEGDEISLKNCSYQKNRWSPVKRLYGIQGENVGFEVLYDQQKIHILNKFKEGSKYYLEHVFMDAGGKIEYCRVYESNNELIEPMLFVENSRLYACWLEQGRIFYSGYNDGVWDKPIEVESDNRLPLQRYNYFISFDEESSSKVSGVYGINDRDLYLFIPNQFINDDKDSKQYQSSQTDSTLLQEDEEIKNIVDELSRLKAENQQLEKTVASYSMQLKKKQRLIEEYEAEIARLMEQKKKSDENFNAVLDVRRNVQNELEKTKQLLKAYEEENAQLKMTNNSIDMELKELRSRLEELSEENRRLQEELQNERNRSAMTRLFKKKVTD